MSKPLRPYLDFAIETAWQAGQLTLGYFQTDIRPTFKADASPVTVADKEAEKLIRQRIEKRFPSHAIVGEEFGHTETMGQSHRWFIDPIDGTRSFVRGVPLYGVLIGLEIEGQVEVGVAHFPALNEMLAAATGEGCWWNGRRARVSNTAHLKNGLVAHYDAAAFAKHNRADEWQRFQSIAEYRAGWCDAYGYLLVATGRAELMLDPIMDSWDCAPFPPILREAGGYFGDWQGNCTIYGNESLATTQTLLPEVLEIISSF
ncbi:inositol monophosphatase family protein [Anaerolineales bacterium HSG6]|nr:inositol monophosphatase family protein [Anaerolineales bacterium HSG6]MDM8532536.1 inositol monophosphatase family protein [Anaerolineales bacterium HSG25]